MLEIRKYTETMFDDAVTIFTQLSAYYLRENASDSQTVAANLQQNIVHEKSAMRILLAYYNGTVCALAAYTIMYPATKETGQLFLKELFVAPEFSRKNIGQQLMAYMARIAIDKNCSRFDWTSNKDSQASVAFYEKLQAPVLERKQYYRLSGDDLYRIANEYKPTE